MASVKSKADGPEDLRIFRLVRERAEQIAREAGKEGKKGD